MSDERTEMVSYLLGRVRELEALVSDLTERLRANAERQRNYRRSKKTAARSNDDVTKTSRAHNEVVTPLQLSSNAVVVSPSRALSLPEKQKQKQKNTKYYSPLADFIREAWPETLNRDLGAQELAWREAHPRVDLLAEAKKARAWQLADPGKRNRPRVLAFLGNWFANAVQTVTQEKPPEWRAQGFASEAEYEAAVEQMRRNA